MRNGKPDGTIKTVWSDFQVMESGLPLCFETSIEGAVGQFTRFALTKRGMEHDAALREVAAQLRVPLVAITSCGRKDSFAETVQEIVVAGAFRPVFSHDRLWLRQLGGAAGPLHLGNHAGNHFAITVYTAHQERLIGAQFKNYFGYQRFGGGNVDAGRYLLAGEYELAFDAWEGTREQWYRDRRFRQKQMGRHLTKAEVVAHPDLRASCQRSIQGWQSYLWNCLAAQTRPITFGQTLSFWTEATADLYDPWWNPTEFSAEMLLLAHPLNRPLLALAKNLRAVRIEGGWQYQFVLRSGAFATVFLGSHYNLRDASVEQYEARKMMQQAGT
jgi:tRNA(Glu) U13 pseudouridine synthase TruD